MIAESQAIADDRTWFYHLRSSAIMIAGPQTIAEVCFHMIADDLRTFCDLRSAIVCDHVETSLKAERKVHKKYRAMVNPGGGYPLIWATRDVPLKRVWFFGLTVLNRAQNFDLPLS